MKTFLRRLPAAAALFTALGAAMVFATPTISFTPGAFPATGSPVAVSQTPAGLNISVNATPTAGASIVAVTVTVNGTNIGSATGSSPFVVNWVPATAGTFTIAATVTDTSAVTTGASASTNTATINSIVTVNAARVASVGSPANNSTVAQNSQIFLRSTATMTDGVVNNVQFILDSGTANILLGTATQAPYNVAHTVTATTGAHTIIARATASDGVTSFDSAPVNITVGAAVGTAPTVAIASPATGTFVATSVATTISATATDADGFIPSTSPGGVTFYADGDPIGTDLTAPYSISWTPTTAKAYSLRALAIDDKGNSTLSSVVTVTAAASVPTVSITAPAANSTAIVGVATSVTATANPSSGASVTQVAFFANGVAIGGAVTTSPYTVSWTPAATGSVALTAQVTDSAGLTATSAAVNVTAANPAPTVSITAPAAGASTSVGTATTVSASATASTGATITQVEFFANGVSIAIDTAIPYSVVWTPTSAGAVNLTAVATQSGGATTTSAAVAVTVNGVNPTVAITAPTAGSAVTVNTATTITATATPSTGATITQVTFLSGGTQIGNPVTVAPYTIFWTPTVTGAASLTARVTDSTGATQTSSAVSVTVAAAQPTVAITAPANGAVATVGSAVTLSASATATPGATVSQVQFLSGTTVLGTATTATGGLYSISWTPTVAGNSTITARVIDSAGGTANSAAITVTAVVSTSVSITSPTNNSSATVGTAQNVTASAAPIAGGTITSVTFFAGGVQILAPVTAAPYTLAWTPATAGVTNLTAQALDSTGGTATSAPISVTVNNSAPTVSLTAPTAGTIISLGSSVNLTATALAGSGGATVAQVQFLAAGVVIATIPGTTSSSTYTTTWIPTGAAPTVSLTARVTDSNNSTVTSTAVPVTVTSGLASVTLATPGAGATLTVNQAATLTAAATPSSGATVTRIDFLLAGAAAPTVIGTALPPQNSISWTPTTAGVATLSARVTDSAGAVATSASVLVNVITGTTTPTTVALTLAPTGSAIPVNSSRVLTATVTSSAAIQYVEFLYNNTNILTDTTAPYGAVFTAPNEVGGHTLRARVVEVTGLETFSTPSTQINITTPIGVAPLAAIIAPTSGAFIAAGAATTISGTASDPDGGITSVQVYVNGATAGLANGGLATLNGSNWSVVWTPATSGVASISALAADNSGNTVAAPAVGVNVTDSTSPTITLSLSPRTAALAASTTLPSGAVRSFVADVTPSTGRAVVRVEFFVDGTKVGEDTSVPYTFRYIAPPLASGEQSRTYVLSARATDNAGAARDVQMPLLVVAPIGQPPATSLLTPANGASVFPGNSVSLAATAVANGGTIASVQFYVNGTPTGINGGNAITAAPYISTFVPTTPGSYTIDAIATDDRGNTTVSNSATFTASFATPTIVFTSPNPNATARATPGVPLTLSATATVQSGAGAAILLVEFLLDGAQIGADTTAPFSISWIPTTAHLGQHVLTARVTDTNSQVAASAPININVANVVGSPPTVSVSASPIPAVFGLQTASTVNFVASAVATGGSTLSNVEIYLNDISIGLATREQATNFYRVAFDLNRFDFTTLTPTISDITGAVTYPVRLYAIARDNNSNQTVSPTSNLIINPATSAPPSVQLIAVTPTNITAGTQFFMAGNINDLDGVVTSLQLFANGSAVGTFVNPQQGQLLTYNAANAGRFNLYAVATDDTGNTAVSSPSIVVNVTAVSAPNTTITRPTDNSTATTVGAPVFLEGTAINTATTQVPTMQFVATAAGGSRQVINGIRVGTTTTYRAIWTPTVPDRYTVSTQAAVGVVQGTSSTNRAVVVTEVLGLAPAVTLTRSPGVAGVPGTATTAASADFCATATDPDGAIVSVEFFLDRRSVGQARKDPQGNTWRVTAPFAGLQPGFIECVALARDSSGNVVASPTSFINVSAAGSIAPSVTVTPSTTNPAFNRQVQLRANARDSDGTVNTVTYFANATAIASSGNAGALFLTNWTPAVSGVYYLWASATDNSNNTTISPTIEVTVRRNNPVLENAAFILQTYQDIANTTNINPIVFDQLDEQLGNGTLTRAELIVSPLTANGGVALTELAGFQPAVNLLAAYYVLMGQWPTPANYTNFLTTVRNNGLAAAVNGILFANEFFARYGVVPTTQLLDNPTSALTAEVFLNRLHQAAGIRPPEPLDRITFRQNNALSATRGRGYAVVGLPTALAEFVTNTNSTNTDLFNRARAAALLYQLTRPPVTVTVDEITTRVNALLALPDMKAVADAVLKDVLYGYRYVTISKNPQSLTVAPRSGVIFSVEAQGAPPLAYQWLFNGAPIANATNAILSLTNADVSRVGTYTVAITSPAATATSDAATLTLNNTPTRLANISTRGVTDAGANVLIGGFVVAGANQQQTRQMMIRVIGPTLANAPFNLTGVLANPRLEVYQGNNPNPVLTNDDWGSQAGGAAQVTAIQQTAIRVGAFTLANNSLDAVVLATLPPGAFTVQAKGPVNNPAATGVVLIEVYDVTPGAAAAGKAANVSTRGAVGTGSNILIAGFVVNGAVSRRVLIRGAGPTLASLGVPGVLADPRLTLIDQGSGRTIATNDNWASGDDASIIASAASAAGAFPFASGSRDSAMIVMLPPGAYTAQLSGVNNGTGVGIVEVYDVDP